MTQVSQDKGSRRRQNYAGGECIYSESGLELTAVDPDETASYVARSSPAAQGITNRIMNPDINRVISFWFDRPPMEWIIAPEGLDADLKAQFSDLVAKARNNELDDWATSPEGSLALVVMLDQFSRNIYRDSPDAFSADEQAWETATRAIAQGFDKVVTVIQASAFYMPLMQRESLISVIAARGLFETLKARCVSEEEHKWVGLGIAAAGTHMEQLLRFGRYPSRNKPLGRKSTEAEEDFLGEHIAKRVAELKKNLE